MEMTDALFTRIRKTVVGPPMIGLAVLPLLSNQKNWPSLPGGNKSELRSSMWESDGC
jgi:hypothetical protein